jgi:hypothetical protein
VDLRHIELCKFLEKLLNLLLHNPLLVLSHIDRVAWQIISAMPLNRGWVWSMSTMKQTEFLRLFSNRTGQSIQQESAIGSVGKEIYSLYFE